MAYCLYADSEQRCCANECKWIATKCHSEKNHCDFSVGRCAAEAVKLTG
jgi:hypothetical protein